jgi:hypothetical protein
MNKIKLMASSFKISFFWYSFFSSSLPPLATHKLWFFLLCHYHVQRKTEAKERKMKYDSLPIMIIFYSFLGPTMWMRITEESMNGVWDFCKKKNNNNRKDVKDAKNDFLTRCYFSLCALVTSAWLNYNRNIICHFMW